MGEKKRVAINMLSQLTSFVVGLAISFVLTRQIAKLLGKDIYGFVGMGNTFTSYITVFTVALNGMLNRYVTIELKQKNYDNARMYFSSVAIADMVITLILVIPASIIVLYIDKFLMFRQVMLEISSYYGFLYSLIFYSVWQLVHLERQLMQLTVWTYLENVL